MDKTDIEILTELANNANVTATKLSEKISLSIPAVNKRIQNLKTDGIIKQSTIITDGVKVGKPILAFVMVIIQSHDKSDLLLKFVNSNVDVLECFSVSGEYDFLLKVVAKDVEALEQKLLELKKQHGIIKSHTLFALRAHKLTHTILP